MRKKSIVIGVCFIFCLMCFTGCGKNESGVEVQPTEQVTVSPEPTTELAATPIPTAEPTAEPTAIPTPPPALIEEPMTGFTSDEELRRYHESICEKYYDENDDKQPITPPTLNIGPSYVSSIVPLFVFSEKTRDWYKRNSPNNPPIMFGVEVEFKSKEVFPLFVLFTISTFSQDR